MVRSQAIICPSVWRRRQGASFSTLQILLPFLTFLHCSCEPQHVRQSAGLFDVGHMVQSSSVVDCPCSSFRLNKPKTLSSFRGPTATQFLEWVDPLVALDSSSVHVTLSVLLNEHGGIIDDTVITKHASDAFYVVNKCGSTYGGPSMVRGTVDEWNSSDRAKDGPVEHEVLDGWGLLALQGTSYPPFGDRTYCSRKNNIKN